MDRTRTLKLALLAGAAVSLQGCVAAIAPIAAASGIMGGSATRDAPEPALAAAPVQAPANDPSVIVERSDQRIADQQALAVETSEVAGEPGENSLASTELESLPEPISPPAIVEQPDETSALAAATGADPVAPGAVEQTSAFSSTADEPASLVDAAESGAPATQLALAVPPTAEPDPIPQPGPVEPEIAPATEDAPLRIIAVDSQVALADRSSANANVSAAEAAAALTVFEAATQPEEASAALARTPRAVAVEPDPLPSATPVETTEMTASTAGAKTPATGSSAAALAAVPPPPAPPPLAPEPAPEPAPERPTTRIMATGAYASLINYANRQQSRSAQNRTSAMLADRASLMPTRAACGGAAPTVLIDLDPEDDKFDPTNVPRAAPGLSSALAQLRASGVKIAWISGNAQSQVRAIREALNRSGLDLENSDELLLMRYPEDRKQTRREDLAASSCLIAIAGDRRTDFDELFEYLLNPEAAATLDPLIENGWFLIPQPLITERPSE